MISHNETMRLIALAQQGDDNACNTLLTENAPLLKSIIKRYLGKHVDYDDLYQIASIGLLKSIKNFSIDYNVKFSTYAVPMILGEIKRYMRDDGYLKVSRSLKSISSKITRYIDEAAKNGEESPRVEDIAKHFGIEPTEVIFAMDSAKMPVSLYETTNDNDGKQTALIDHIPTDDDKKMVDKVILKDMLARLEPREQKIIILRYFRDMTQGEIAQKMGVSQVQISRLENRILKKLKDMYNG
ncbi:MAG: SigB/SigF/SigG family RNA polymerase sigma factor [Clostridia bacterium]|nr:SigB/SigF/SigG family RNA polymerase sigma factor [Clostridia bacterium]